MDRTIIYYTSNKEDEKFEQNIRNHLVRSAGSIPIISVSQKPILLGKNICVGEIGASNLNIYKQLLIGCEAATTKFVITAEADCLYPPEYFSFTPPVDNMCYRYENLWILHTWKEGFYRKNVSQCGQIIGREYFIELLKKIISEINGQEATPVWKTFKFDNPIVNIKTGRGLRKLTWIDKRVPPRNEIPYWGSYYKLKEELL